MCILKVNVLMYFINDLKISLNIYLPIDVILLLRVSGPGSNGNEGGIPHSSDFQNWH